MDDADVMDVLLVDDEPSILRALRRLLRANPWRIHVAGGAAQALATLDAVDVDVVVTDYQMPGMDGSELLDAMRERHASTTRIMLTGEISQAPAIRTTVLAHQFLRKPCEPERLFAAIRRAQVLRDVLDDPAVRRSVGSLGSLPTPPRRWSRLQELLEAPSTREEDVAELVAQDAAMSAKVLQLANSAFLGLPRQVLDVHEAVALVGMRVIRTMNASTTAFRPTADGLEAVPVLEIAGLHSRTCAALLREVVADRDTAAAAATAATLQDVGILLAAERDAQRFASHARRARRDGVALHEVERDEMGHDHADLGRYLALLWGLPDPLPAAIGGHHVVTTSGAAASSVTHLVQAARLVVQDVRPELGDPFAVTVDVDRVLDQLLGDERRRWSCAAKRLDPFATRAVAA